eukprot:SAG11_NODE_24857_length_367_cov_0.574627_1_plen_64_part_00
MELVNPLAPDLHEKISKVNDLCEKVANPREFITNAAIFASLAEAGLEQAHRLAVGLAKYTVRQ